MSRKIAGVAPARTTVAAAGLLLAAGLGGLPQFVVIGHCCFT